MPYDVDILNNRFVRAEIEREQKMVDRHRAEQRRFDGVRISGSQPEPRTFRTVEQCIDAGLEAERQWNEPEAVMVRALIAAANAGNQEAERIYSAYSRGDATWQDRAQALLSQAKAA